MTNSKGLFSFRSFSCIWVSALLTMATPLGHTATLWTGPNINFTQSSSSSSDVILAGKVVLTRGKNQVLFNTAAGENAAGSSSPADTEWAFGLLANFSTLTYQSLGSMRNGDLASLILNQQMVVHLINEDIYLSVKFTAWGQHGAGGFAYTRSTAAGPSPPSVSIRSPSRGAVLTAPAAFQLTASASSSGTVTNVEYFAGSTPLGHATVAPFSVTGNISTPGSYGLTAVATAAGLSGTSAVVNITVVGAPTATITSPTNGAVFVAAANVKVSANASVTGGTVTNVSFFMNATLLGSVQSPAFSLIASNLAAGSYSLTAVATASGISSTSSVVNITVISTAGVSLTSAAASNGVFSFNYSATPGVNYVVQSSSNLLDWISVVTNLGASNPVLFSNTLDPGAPRFFRVGRLSGP